MDNYNSDGNDPVKLSGIINALRRELQEERAKRHTLQSTHDTHVRKMARMEHALHTMANKTHGNETTTTTDQGKVLLDLGGEQEEHLIRRLQSRAKHLLSALSKCQAQRDDLQVHIEGQERIKEWMDEQLKALEQNNTRLNMQLAQTIKQRDDAIVQMTADSEIKDFLALQWEQDRIKMHELDMICQELRDQKNDLAVQIAADKTMKEYMAGQLEVLEEQEKRRTGTRSKFRSKGRY